MAKRTSRGESTVSKGQSLSTLSVDIGGTGVKCSVLDDRGAMMHDKVWRPTPHPCLHKDLIEMLEDMAKELPPFERISVGFPGAVRDGRVLTAPHFPPKDWDGFDLAGEMGRAFGKPVRVLNDAEVQGYGVISGHGLEMVLTLGTGAGTAIFKDGRLAPHLELAQHPVHRKKTYNEYVGRDALADVGSSRWNKRVRKVIGILYRLVYYDRLFIGGGNSRRIEGALPPNSTVVSNDAGITGGIALWKDAEQAP